MKVAALLDARRQNWQELELLCREMEGRKRYVHGGAGVGRFAAMYRAVCADLALAGAYQLPPQTVAYLHQLVGRAHNQLYRSQGFRISTWAQELLVDVPARLFHDHALKVAFAVFWGLFALAASLAYGSRDFAELVTGKDGLARMEEMYEEPLHGRDPDERAAMVGFYIQNNTSIGLRCFALGLLGGVGGLVILVANSLQIGATFGHMAASPARDNFYEFVTAHGPFELTAVVLSAAAGMRLGFSLVHTRGWTRRASLERAGREAMPTMAVAIVLFFLAALIEAFVSPSALPYALKALLAAVSSSLLSFYFVVLGQPGMVRIPGTTSAAASQPLAESTPVGPFAEEATRAAR